MGLYIMSVDAVALGAGTAKSIAELTTASSDQIKLKEWWVEFDGVTATAVPVKVELGTFSAAVTTATTFTAGKYTQADGTPATVAKHTTSTEGAGTIQAHASIHRVPPTSGLWYVAPLGQEQIVPVSAFWRIRCTAAAAVNVTFGVIWDE